MLSHAGACLIASEIGRAVAVVVVVGVIGSVVSVVDGIVVVIAVLESAGKTEVAVVLAYVIETNSELPGARKVSLFPSIDLTIFIAKRVTSM